jgi:2-keto-4-pentenoate hydratase
MAGWLAKTMAQVGRPLKKGNLVLSGGLGPMVGVDAGDAVTARINGLGSVTAFFSG